MITQECEDENLMQDKLVLVESILKPVGK
jgi:hypothetical protein